MSVLPRALEKLVDELGSLPGVGPRTAERYAYHLLQSDAHKSKRLAESISSLHESVGYCQKTFALVEAGQSVSLLYSDDSRDKTTIAVVEDPLDIVPIEKTGSYKGTYHVLHGLLSPIDGIGPQQLHIESLIKRIKEDSVTEIILAMSSSVEGETTALYLQKHLPEGLKITRLARGLPAGVDIEYADQITLQQAFEGRQAI